MEVACDITLDYLKNTQGQFGRAIGKFQAAAAPYWWICVPSWSRHVHGHSGCLVADEADNASVPYADWAPVQINRCGRKVAEEGYQLHGGIAMNLGIISLASLTPSVLGS